MAAIRAALPHPLWAEVVPGAPFPMTTDDLQSLPDDGWVYELVNGILVRMPLSSGGASNVSTRLIIRLGAYVEANGLGIVTGEQGGYRLDPQHPRDTEVGPDVAFVRADRAPSPGSPEYYGQAWQLAPDLAVEVVSQHQFAPGMRAKAQFYLRCGTRLVWIIWPRYQRVDVWRPGADVPVTLGIDDTLDGEDVVPGFTCPIAHLFP
jgi:Uma2 family endonuclease